MTHSNKGWALIAALSLASTASGATPGSAAMFIDMASGKLYWDISPEVRILYTYECKGETTDNWTSDLAYDLDVFGVLSHTDRPQELGACGARGLQAYFRFREDGTFPGLSPDYSIMINNEELALPGQFGNNSGHYYAQENYQKLFAQQQHKRPVDVRLYKLEKIRYSTERRLIAETRLDTSEISNAESQIKNDFNEELQDHNLMVTKKHRQVFISASFTIFSCLALLAVAWRSGALQGLLRRARSAIGYSCTAARTLAGKISDSLPAKPQATPISVASELSMLIDLHENAKISKDEFESAKKALFKTI